MGSLLAFEVTASFGDVNVISNSVRLWVVL